LVWSLLTTADIISCNILISWSTLYRDAHLFDELIYICIAPTMGLFVVYVVNIHGFYRILLVSLIDPFSFLSF
jgi:hypothetical protein